MPYTPTPSPNVPEHPLLPQELSLQFQRRGREEKREGGRERQASFETYTPPLSNHTTLRSLLPRLLPHTETLPELPFRLPSFQELCRSASSSNLSPAPFQRSFSTPDRLSIASLTTPNAPSSSQHSPLRIRIEELPPSTSPPSEESNGSFAPPVIKFSPNAVWPMPFYCSHCKRSQSISDQATSKRISTSCEHYTPCNECRCRVVRQLLRCPTCCMELVGKYPGCSSECLQNCQDAGIGLATSGCPRCDSKLVKEKCSTPCNRRTSQEYHEARSRLNQMTAVLVLRPDHCGLLDTIAIGTRPCSHYSMCPIHHTIRKGRACRAQCPKCKGHDS